MRFANAMFKTLMSRLWYCVSLLMIGSITALLVCAVLEL